MFETDCPCRELSVSSDSGPKSSPTSNPQASLLYISVPVTTRFCHSCTTLQLQNVTFHCGRSPVLNQANANGRDGFARRGLCPSLARRGSIPLPVGRDGFQWFLPGCAPPPFSTPAPSISWFLAWSQIQLTFCYTSQRMGTVQPHQ